MATPRAFSRSTRSNRRSASALESEEVGERQIVDIGRKIDGKTHAGSDSRGLAAHPARIEEQFCAAPVQPVEREVRRDVKIGDDTIVDVLVHRDDAGADRLGGRRRFEGLAGKRDHSVVARVDAGKDAHERGFAGAVRAHQNRHRAGLEVEVHPLEHRYRPKGFAHAPNAKHRLFAHSLLPMKAG
jgi:hypothetical protein